MRRVWNPGVFGEGAEVLVDSGWSYWRPDAVDAGDGPEAPPPPPDAQWRPCAVPAAWETYGVPKAVPGPVWLRTTITVPSDWNGDRALLHFGAVSYACRIFWNGQPVGAHQGAWDAFDVDLTGLAEPGRPGELLLCVHKPGGRYPLRKTLAGFLPYVGTMFGGIWQPVSLRRAGDAVIKDIALAPWPDLRGVDLHVSWRWGDVSRARAVRLGYRVRSADGALVAEGQAAADAQGTDARLPIPMPQARPWSPEDPHLHTVEVYLEDPDPLAAGSQTFGLRHVRSDGRRILLNGGPIYPRGVLDWGWDPARFAPAPARDEVDDTLTRMRALGFNMVKHCLYVPAPDYLEAADESGTLTWLELPMWLPDPDPEFEAQTLLEYARILRQVRHHPSLVLCTLGCELNASATPGFLGRLYDLCREMLPGVLIRDNSGSGECYGGNVVEFADFYDHHFYAEPHLFRGVLDAFSPRARGPRPWLFGEFCDADAFRDLAEVAGAHGADPWWMRDDPVANPQGVRWEYSVVAHRQRLAEAGVADRSAEMVAGACEQALLVRKLTFETVRSYEEISGYVVLGVRDTPISTPGMLDDLGRARFPAEAFSAFNADSVLILGWDRRRAWIAGGDRPHHLDVYNYRSAGTVRPHLTLSHTGAAPAREIHYRWEAAWPDGTVVARGHGGSEAEVGPAEVREIGVAEFVAPEVRAPRKLLLRAWAQWSGGQTANAWELWVHPAERPTAYPFPVGLYDPAEALAGCERLYPFVRRVDAAEAAEVAVLIATDWPAGAERALAAGARWVLCQTGPAPLPSAALPFWREAHKLFETHPVWDHVPHEGYTGTGFCALASDHALEIPAATAWLRGQLAEADPVRPILWRVDSRNMATHAYLAQARTGRGHLWATTLRVGGGQGTQPGSLGANVAGQRLLEGLLAAALPD